MNLQSKLIISAILLFLVALLIRNYRRKRISTGQILVWITLLLGGEALALSPGLVGRLSVLWGNLMPVSWIAFSGLVILILYMLHHTFLLNELRAHAVELARNITFLEERVRELESSEHESTDPPGT